VTDFTENFDGVSTPDLPSCWSPLLVNTVTGTQPAVRTSTAGDNSLPNGAQLYSGSFDGNIGSGNGDEGETILVSPELSNLAAGTHRVRFFADAGTSTSTLEIGTMSDPTDFSTYTAIQTFTPTTTHAEYTLNFDTYTGTDSYIAFRHIFVSTFDSMYLDDIVWEPIPACVAPNTFALDVVTDVDATFSWVNGTVTDVELIYGAPGFGGTGGTTIQASGTSGTITGLTAQTDYDVFIRQDCTGSSNGFSVLVGPISITTACSPFSAPFFEDFNASTSRPNCWLESGSKSWNFNQGADYTAANAENLPSARGGNFAWVDGSSASGPTVISNLDTPYVDISTLSTPELSFYIYSHYATGMTQYNRTEVLVNDNGAGFVSVYDQRLDTGDEWDEIIIPLTGYTGPVQVRFRITHDGTPNAYNNDILIDDVSFRDPIVCPEPDTLTFLSSTTTTADVSWNDNAGSGVATILWGDPGFDPTDPTQYTEITGINGTSTTITGLMPASTYDFYVISDCTGASNGLSTAAGPASITTQCVAITDFSENFDNVSTPDLPNCWTSFSTVLASGTQPYVETSTLADNTVPNGVRLYSGSLTGVFGSGTTTEGENMLISPVLSNLAAGTHRVRFFADAGTSTSTLEVGTLSDPTDPSSFVSIQAISPTTTHTEYIVDFDTYSGTDTYIGFRHIFAGTFDSMYLDDIVWEAIPACLAPSGLTVSGTTATTADVSWTDNSGSGVASIRYGAAGFDPTDPAQYTELTGINGTSTTITGLMPATIYDFYVISDCTATSSGFSTAEGPGSFQTACAPIAAPYFQDFEGFTPGPFVGSPQACFEDLGIDGFDWEADNSGSTGSTTTGPPSAFSGSTFIFTEASSPSANGDDAILQTPEFDISALNNPELTFYYHAWGDNMGTFEVAITTDGGATYTTIWTRSGEQQANQNDPWREAFIDLSAYSGTLQFQFKHTLGGVNPSPQFVYNGDFSIDDFKIDEAPYRYSAGAWNRAPEGVATTTDRVMVMDGSAVLTGALNTGDLFVADGASLDASAGDVSVSQALTNNGTITGINNIIMNGAAGQTISSDDDAEISRLEIDNAAGVVQTGTLGITDQLVLTTGNLDATGGDLVFVSTATQTAAIAQLDPSVAGLIGDVTTQRYVPPKYVWRMMTPSANSSGTIRDNWQDGGGSSSGEGTQITGPGGSANGFDPTATNNPSLFEWDNLAQSYVAVAATNTGNMTAGTPYRIFVRGDRTFDMTDVNAGTSTSTETVLEVEGALNQGDVTFNNLSNAPGDFIGIGNPYMATVNMGPLLQNSSAGIDFGQYYVWDPTLGTQGAYTTYVFATGTNSAMGSNVDGTLRSSQHAYFLASGGNASITFRESDKTNSTQNIGVFSTGGEIAGPAKIHFGLYAEGDNLNRAARDGALIFLDQGYNSGFDLNDAPKLQNPDENLSVNIEGNQVSVSRMGMPSDNSVVNLNSEGYTAGSYTMVVETVLPQAGMKAYFVDRMSGNRTELIDGARTEIAFDVDANSADSINPARFYVVFSVDETVSNEFAEAISIYPNPVSGEQVNIALPVTDSETVSVSVTNMLGQTVINRTFEKTGGVITLEEAASLQTGIYTIKITDGAQVATEKLVVE
jgi:hypothetical protein